MTAQTPSKREKAEPGAAGQLPAAERCGPATDEQETILAQVLDVAVPAGLPALLQAIVERASKLLGGSGGRLYLSDPDCEQVRLVVSHNVPDRQPGTVQRYGEGVAGTVAGTGRPLIVDSGQTFGLESAKSDEDLHDRGVLAVPIIWQGRVIGVLDVLRSAQDRAFDRDDVQWLELFANHATLAVENARFCREAQREVAERKQLEMQSQERRLYLEGVLASAPDAIVTLDAQYHVLEWNRGAEELFGYSREEAQGRDIDDLIAVHDLEVREEAIGLTRQLLSGKPVPPLSTIRYRKDGTRLDVIAAGSPMFIEEDLVGVVAVYRDITERKHIEEALRRQTQDLEAAVARLRDLDHLKSEFMQNVSHELRTPLALIWGYANLLTSGDLGDLPSHCRGPIESIVRQAATLSALVDDITLIMASETRTLVREPVSMEDVVRTTVEDFQLTARQASLALTAEIAPNLPPVLGAPVYLRRVLDNLLENAIKFTPPGGGVAVRLWQEGDRVLLRVTDSGIGIPHGEQERVFERFYQVDGTARRRYGGAGLGLALVREIVEACDGTVSVQSQVGEGSAFTVSLPASH